MLAFQFENMDGVDLQVYIVPPGSNEIYSYPLTSQVYIPSNYKIILDYSTTTDDFDELGKKIRGGFSREVSFTSWL